MSMHMCVRMYVDMCMYVYVYVKRLELFSRLALYQVFVIIIIIISKVGFIQERVRSSY